MRVPLRRVAWLVGFGLWLVARAAPAWVETRLIADDVQVEIDRSGSAVIHHRIRMKVAGGPLRSFDLAGVDKDVMPLDDSTVASAQLDGVVSAPIPLALVTRPEGGLRVNVASPRGLARGVFLFHVRYRRNLLAVGDIRRDGAMLRVRFSGPSWPEGRDNARCTFVLPFGPTEPRPPSLPVRGDDGDRADVNEAGIFISDVKRAADHDEVELVRPHVARNEAVNWSVRIDPRALGEIHDPRLRPLSAPPPLIAGPSTERRVSYFAASAAILFGFSLLVGCKSRQVARHARGIAVPRPSIPMGAAPRILLAGPVLTAGIAMQLRLADPFWGTLLVLLAMGLTWYRQPTWHRLARGPGRWLPLADSEAFAELGTPPDDAWLDASTARGRLLFVLSLTCVAILTYVTSRVSVYHAYLVAFDGAVLFPLFGTGRLSDLPPHPLFGPGPRLGRLARNLRAGQGIRAIAVGRLPEGRDQFDELRLLCTPRIPRRGFAGIEVGWVMVGGTGGFIYLPELLVRVIEASPCHEAFLHLLPGSRWMRGRRADERVTSLRPRLPTLEMTTALAARLLDHAVEKAPPRVAGRETAHSVRAPSEANAANGTKARTRSSGSPERASKAGTVSSPLHPM